MITARDKFAMTALNGILSGPAVEGLRAVAQELGVDVCEAAARSAYEYADAMITARKSDTVRK